MEPWTSWIANDLIDRYRDGYRAVTAALAGITDAELDKRPAAGAWTAREVVHHLADSETDRLHPPPPAPRRGRRPDRRLRRGRVRPPACTTTGRSSRRSPCCEPSASANAELLDALEPHDLERTGKHTESGAYGVDTWLAIYADHAHDHADQIRRAREGRSDVRPTAPPRPPSAARRGDNIVSVTNGADGVEVRLGVLLRPPRPAHERPPPSTPRRTA